MMCLGTIDGFKADAHASISDICAASWRALAGPDQPYLDPRHFSILENTRLIGETAGTIPHYVTLADAGGKLLGAAPVFLKTHSHGELGIDWGLPLAHERTAGPYFPKLALEVPLTPWAGPRLLVGDTQNGAAIRHALLKAVDKIVLAVGAKSVQILYGSEQDQAAAMTFGYTSSETLTFIWRSRGEPSFDAFRASLSQKGRNRLRDEYEKVVANGLVIKRIDGADITPTLIDKIYDLYCDVFRQHAHAEWLNKFYFERLVLDMPETVELLTASQDGALVAGMWCLRGERIIFGQHWVTNSPRNSLLFALMYCSYKLAIERGYLAVDFGTVGAHKALRGAAPEPLFHAVKFADANFQSLAETVLKKRNAATQSSFQAFARQVPYKDKRLAE